MSTLVLEQWKHISHIYRMKYYVSIFLWTLIQPCISQKLKSNKDKIDAAKKEVSANIRAFNSCLVSSNLDECILNLTKGSDTGYKKYVVGSVLFDIDKGKSYQFHKEAYESNPTDSDFNLEYALELHRNGNYSEAAKLYESYIQDKPEDFRLNVWLADCYINMSEIKMAILHWSKADHASHHTSIDQAIWTIYGYTDQVRKRSEYRQGIAKGNSKFLYELIFLDMNWKLDWWNTNTQEYFLKEDIRLLTETLKKDSYDHTVLTTYVKIKNLSQSPGTGDSIKFLLANNKMIINSNPLPPNGQIASDLLRICFMNQLISEKEFYEKRGDELLQMARETMDKELLNIYAYLQATVNTRVNASIDKEGWEKFKDDRFALSYFIGKADKNKFGDKELEQALTDFPNSSGLYWIKVNCAKIENKKLSPYLIELIKREFKSLGSDPSHYSYSLNSYFEYLNTAD